MRIIKLGLCPFAWQSIQDNKLGKKVILENSLDIILEKVMEEIYFLEDHPEMESSLITIPNALESFDDFLAALEMANQLLVDSGFEGKYQFASFHPQYQFTDTAMDDPSNYTNRAPYPIFHPIRESAMTKAIASHPDIDAVPIINMKKTRSLGIHYMEALFKSCFKIS